MACLFDLYESMRLLRRHKYILLSLGIYWPGLFVLTHIPVMQIAGQSGMSDKTMHTLAYLMLTFFVWLAINPYQKVQWNKAKAWIVLGIILGYGAADEWIQSLVGRQMEFLDWVSDIKGAVMGLAILSILSFWPAILTVSSIFIFAISNLSHLLQLYPKYYLNTVFHLTAFVSLTLIWIQYMDRKPGLGRDNSLWPLIAFALPMALLAAVKLGGVYYKKPLWWVDIATAIFGIAAAVLISWLLFYFTRKKTGSEIQ